MTAIPVKTMWLCELQVSVLMFSESCLIMGPLVRSMGTRAMTSPIEDTHSYIIVIITFSFFTKMLCSLVFKCVGYVALKQPISRLHVAITSPMSLTELCSSVRVWQENPIICHASRMLKDLISAPGHAQPNMARHSMDVSMETLFTRGEMHLPTLEQNNSIFVKQLSAECKWWLRGIMALAYNDACSMSTGCSWLPLCYNTILHISTVDIITMTP